jgi:hypothetical protein
MQPAQSAGDNNNTSWKMHNRETRIRGAHRRVQNAACAVRADNNLNGPKTGECMFAVHEEDETGEDSTDSMQAINECTTMSIMICSKH